MTPTRLQLSRTFSQLHWPGFDPDPSDASRDADDCWVVAGLSMIHAAAPWLRLPSVRAARAAAGDPDDGDTDGGRPAETMRLVRGIAPELAPFTRKRVGVPAAELAAALAAGRPVSAAIMAAALPARLRRGFAGAHQVVAGYADGRGLVLLDPLAPPHSAPARITLAELERAAAAYAGAGRATFIAGPTAAEALTVHPLAHAIEATAAAREARRVALELAATATATALAAIPREV